MDPRPLAALFLVLLAGCWTMDHADLVAIGRKHHLAMTESSGVPESIEPIASLQVAKSGFYLFGFVPVVGISMDEALDALAERAAEAGAYGVCGIRYLVTPANPLKFLVFPIPDWSADIQVFGMAYRNRASRASAPPR
ncbi:MAG: hypothetical protein Fur0037_23640 [Planctomycetota bacterium]